MDIFDLGEVAKSCTEDDVPGFSDLFKGYIKKAIFVNENKFPNHEKGGKNSLKTEEDKEKRKSWSPSLKKSSRDGKEEQKKKRHSIPLPSMKPLTNLNPRKKRKKRSKSSIN